MPGRRPDHVQVLVLNNIPVFFAERDGPWFPTLRLLHQYPDMMVKLRVDAGEQCVRPVQPAAPGDAGIAQACIAVVCSCSSWGSLCVPAAKTFEVSLPSRVLLMPSCRLKSCWRCPANQTPVSPHRQLPAGAIKFVMSGANIMCRGLTSPGATIHEEVTTPALQIT